MRNNKRSDEQTPEQGRRTVGPVGSIGRVTAKNITIVADADGPVQISGDGTVHIPPAEGGRHA